jgi:hypothetical protein
VRPPALSDDQHPLLREVREPGQVERDLVGTWLVSHHADASAGRHGSHLSREPWRSPVYRQHRHFFCDSTLERTAP